MKTLQLFLPRAALAGLPLITAALLARSRRRGPLGDGLALRGLTFDSSDILAELTERNDGP